MEAERRSRVPELGPPGSSRRRAIFFAVTGPLALGVLLFFREVLTPFALAVIVAYVLAPLVSLFQRARIGRWSAPRWVAVVIIYVALLSGLGATLAVAVPRLAVEVTVLTREAPETIHTIQEDWLPQVESALEGAANLYGGRPPGDEAIEPAPEAHDRRIHVSPEAGGGYAITLPPGGIEVVPQGENEFRIEIADRSERERRDLGAFISTSIRRFFRDTEAYAGTAIRGVQSFVAQVVGGVFSFFIMLMLSAYMLITSERITAFFRFLAPPAQRDRFDDLVTRIDRGLAGVVRGQLLIALVNGLLSGVGFWLADLRYWPILTVIATLLSIIPIFGAILSSVPAVLVGLQNGVGTAVFVLAWIIGIHQLEANILNPKIMGDAAKVHPVLVVFALLAGEHVFGIVGALLAVPLLSITQSIFLHFREVALGVPRDPALAAEWAEATLDRPPDEEE